MTKDLSMSVKFRSKTKKPKRFNFVELEDRVNECYIEFRKLEDSGKRSTEDYGRVVGDLYRALSDLVYGVLCVNPPQLFLEKGYDLYDEAGEIALSFIDRMRSGRLKFSLDQRGAWTRYVRVCLIWHHTTRPSLPQYKSVSYEECVKNKSNQSDYNKSSQNNLGDFECVDVDKKKLISYWADLLLTYYPRDYLVKALPILISSYLYDLDIPDSLRLVRTLIASLLRRLCATYSDPYNFVGSSLSENSIDHVSCALVLINYLSLSEKPPIPFELSSSLSFSSLVRLALEHGGKKVYIPTIEEIELVVSSAVALSDTLISGVPYQVSRYRGRRILNSKFNVKKMNKFVRGMLESFINNDSFNILKELNLSNEQSFLEDLSCMLNQYISCQVQAMDNLGRKLKFLDANGLVELLKSLYGAEGKLLSLLENLNGIYTQSCRNVS